MRAEQKIAKYAEIGKEIDAVLEGETNLIARMATVSNMLHHAFDYYFWTGFYTIDPDNPEELVIGPYQGTLGCIRIPMGRGVCGQAAARRETIIVDDVHAYSDHIACDARSRSEIVVPVFNESGGLIAVFDVDSDREAMFDEKDRAGIEMILKNIFARAVGV